MGSASSEQDDLLQPGKGPRRLHRTPRPLIWLLSRRQCPSTSYPVPSCPSCEHLLLDFPIMWGCSAAGSSQGADVGSQALCPGRHQLQHQQEGGTWWQKRKGAVSPDLHLKTVTEISVCCLVESQLAVTLAMQTFMGCSRPLGMTPAPCRASLTHVWSRSAPWPAAQSNTPQWDENQTRLFSGL